MRRLLAVVTMSTVCTLSPATSYKDSLEGPLDAAVPRGEHEKKSKRGTFEVGSRVAVLVDPLEMLCCCKGNNRSSSENILDIPIQAW